MDFKDTPEEAAFRDEARQWLEANVPADDALKDSTKSNGPNSGRNASMTLGGPVFAGRRNTVAATLQRSNK